MNTHHRTATIAIVTVLASLSLTGCGGGQSERKVTDTSTGQGAVEPFGAVAQAEASPAASVPPGRIIESVPADSLPPDVAASAADSMATPGSTVEFTAQASADAVEVFLWDGIGRKQSFAYDSTANVWRARYRVPLGAAAGRIGIAVTAKNGLGLKSRVWVFVRVERQASAETPEKQAEPEQKTGQ